jgi:hypothetical protein
MNTARRDERALDGGPTSVLFVFDWKGLEQEVEKTVDEGVVEGEVEDDGFGGEH